MQGFLGETSVDVATHPEFSKYGPDDWALYYIELYGQTDGEHHKAWVLDQVARILQGTPVIVTEAFWDNGQSEYRMKTGEPSSDYLAWVINMRGEYNEKDDEYEYNYDKDIAP
jgi:hypothetical protein